MSKLDSYKSKAPDIVGSTTINHAARVKLGLTCSEYVILDHLFRQETKEKMADTLTTYIKTGFEVQEAHALFNALVIKGFIYINGPDSFELTDKWREAFPDIELEFENCFWLENGKVAWTGTKKKALEHYIRIRQKYSKDFIVTQRTNYFEFLKLQKQLRNFDQQKLMAQVFLNPSTERFCEDYADYNRQLKEKYGNPDKVKPNPISREEVMNQYGKDNNE